DTKKWLSTNLSVTSRTLHLRINMRVSSFLQFRHLYLCAYFVSGCYYSIDICITIFMYLRM
ncbi:mCG1041622, partial [Mus musculus]